MLPIEKIVASTDFSDPSRSGIRTAVELAEKFDAEVILVHVMAPLKTVYGATTVAGYHLPTVEEEMEIEAAQEAEKILQEEVPEKLDSSFRVLHGKPAEKIAEAAVEENADLIVMASRGESGWKELLTGSVAERVLRHAECPVLTVTRPKSE